MAEGLNAPSLHILAGLPENENEYVLYNYFLAAVRELDIELPDEREAAIEVGLAIAEEIITGKQSPFEGVIAMKQGMLDAYNFKSESKEYIYDSIGFARVYGLLITIEDLKDSGATPWQEDKTNAQLEAELLKELVKEVQDWKVWMNQHV
jgi:hypothetical protein